MSLPEFPVEGGCQCGAVRYRLKASPLSVYNCHCKDCQRFSGAAWSMSMVMREGEFEVLSGEVAQYRKRADSGNEIVMNFCATCHGWLWNDPPAGGIKVVRAGTLDNNHATLAGWIGAPQALKEGNRMPGFGAVLDGRELRAVAAWLGSLR